MSSIFTKAIHVKEDLPLTPASIDSASEKIEEFLKEQNTERSVIIKTRLLAEQFLLMWMEKEVSKEFTLSYGVKSRRPYLQLQAAGIPCNVLEDNDSDDSVLVNFYLRTIGFRPFYSYQKGNNIVQFNISPGKKSSPLIPIFISIAAGLLLGLGVHCLLPAAAGDFLLTNFVDPLYSTVFRLLGYISGPLILFSVTWGIYGIGDATDFKHIGKNVLLHYLGAVFFVAALSTALTPLFHLTADASQQDLSGLQDIVEMILDIVPSNIIEPLYSGNTLQIIFTAILLGIAMIFLHKRVASVADIVEQTNYIVQFLMGCISRMLPYFIFLIMLRLVLSSMLSLFGSVWKLFLLYLGSALILAMIFTLFVAIRYRVSPVRIVRKSLPAFLIAFTTASSSAAFSTLLETSREKFGIDESLTSFGLPLGMVMCKSSTVVFYMLISLFFAKQFGVSVSVPWVISAAFVSAMLAIATPPIPGGSTTAYTMLFARLLIPTDALAVVLSIDIIFDFFLTAFDMYNLPLILITSADSLKKLDKDVLRGRAG